MSYPRKSTLYVLIILTCAFIWGNSLMPASVSAAFSGWVHDRLSWLLGHFTDTPSDDGILRKIAHGTEFLVLALFVTTLLREIQKKPISLVLIWGLLTALIDETIQLVVPGRCGAVTDVWIDFGGYLTGFLLIFLFWRHFSRNSHKETVIP